MQVEVENRLFLFTLMRLLLAQGNDLPQDLDVKA